jgi:hypothetical protein
VGIFFSSGCVATILATPRGEYKRLSNGGAIPAADGADNFQARPKSTGRPMQIGL